MGLLTFLSLPLEGAAKEQDLQRHSGGFGAVGGPFVYVYGETDVQIEC